MYRLHYQTLFHPKQLDRKTRTFVSITINAFGFHLISIFIPIFLYLEGFSLADISLFYVILFAVRMLATNFASRITQDIGPSRSLQIGYVSALLAIASMIALTADSNPSYSLLVITAIANGLNQGFYFLARHINVEMITTEKNAGSTIGWLTIAENIFLAIAPYIGGVIAAVYGVTSVLIISFVIILISTIYVIGEKSETSLMYNHNHANFRISTIKYDLWANLSSNFDWAVALFAWPLFIFIILDNIEQVGAISTISGLSLIPVMIWVAKNADKKGSSMLRVGSYIRAFIYPLRALLSSFFMAVGINMLADFGYSLRNGGLLQHFYKRADRLGRLRYTYAMEIASSFGALISWLIIGVISLLFDTVSTLQIVFVLSAFITPLAVLFNHSEK